MSLLTKIEKIVSASSQIILREMLVYYKFLSKDMILLKALWNRVEENSTIITHFYQGELTIEGAIDLY
jgi:hypothetical protein